MNSRTKRRAHINPLGVDISIALIFVLLYLGRGCPEWNTSPLEWNTLKVAKIKLKNVPRWMKNVSRVF